VKEAHVCEQLAPDRYLTAERPRVELASSRVASQRHNQGHRMSVCLPISRLKAKFHYTSWFGASR